jgi:predicted RND superfamily exporter protein
MMIGDIAARRRGLVLLTTAILVFAAVALGSRLRLDTDILEMVPRGNPKIDAFKSSLRDFGGIDYLLILVEAPPGHSAEEYEDFVDSFAERLTEVSEIQSVEDRLGGNDELIELFQKHALLFLHPDELPTLERILSDDGIRSAIEQDRRILESPSSAFLKDLVRRDPLGIGRLVFARLLSGRQGLRLNAIDGYYMSEDGTSLLLLAKPVRPAQHIKFARELMDKVSLAEAEARRAEEEEGRDLSGMAVRYGGTYVSTLEDSDLIRGDLRLTAICSFVGVLAVYLIGYRRWAALLYSSVPLLVGQALTFALAALVLGRLNSASSGFVAMLMGLGTDFTIIMYARFVEARRSGQDVTNSVRRMMAEASLGVFTGAITSAGTFYALCTTQFLGLKELGILIGSGMLFCLVAIFFLLPAMLQWNENRPLRRGRPPARMFVQSFGVERLIPLVARNRRLTLLVATALVLFLAHKGWNISFSDSVRNLRNPDNRGVVVSDKVAEKFGGSLNVMMAIIDASGVEEALGRMSALHERAEPYLEDGTISAVDSLIRYLPPAANQGRIIRALHEGSENPDGPFALARIEASLHAELDRQGFRPGALDGYLPDLRSMLAVEDPVGVEKLEGRNLGSLLGRYIKETENGYRAAVYIYLDRSKWRREAPPGLVEALGGEDSSVVVTGVNIVSRELRTIFTRDSWKAITIGLVLVTILLALDLRSFRLAMLANAQVLGGIIMMFGVMSLLDIQLNFVNSFTAIMVLGFGVDYGIHMIHRIRASGWIVDAGVLETGKAVTMAALTNIAGFGSLTLSSYPAMKSMGIVAIVGSVSCLLTSLSLVPAVLARGVAPGREERTNPGVKSAT